MAEPDLTRPTRRIETFAQFQFSARWWMYFPLLVFVYAILGWGYYAYVVAFCIHHLLQELNLPTVSVILLLIFHAFFGLAVVSYVQACVTNPGEIPDGFGEAEDESAPETPLMRETKGSGQVRYCQKCQKKKPDRAHHCSTCRRCVLRMDHHCPWVNNCVGWGNYKFFMLFLGWVSVLCLYSGISAAYFAGVALTKPSHDVPLQLIGVVIVGTVFGLGLMLFAGFHVRLILNNQTTIESTEKMQRLAGHKNIYNLGSKLRNWNQVFGFNVALWFIPLPSTPGDGLSYPTKLDDIAGTEQEPILSEEKSK